MKLSEAIRLGAMLKPQGFGLGAGGAKAQATCALGAAYEAAHVIGSWPALVLAFPQLTHIEKLACPVCGDTQDGLIAHINDDHLWTREAIADWIEGIERAHDPVIATEDHSSMEPAMELGALAPK